MGPKVMRDLHSGKSEIDKDIEVNSPGIVVLGIELTLGISHKLEASPMKDLHMRHGCGSRAAFTDRQRAHVDAAYLLSHPTNDAPR